MGRLAGRAAITLAGAAAVVVGVGAFTWVLLRTLRPNLFPSEPGAARQLGEFLERAFLHFDFEGPLGGTEVNRLIAEGVPQDVALYAGGLVTGLVIGIGAGLACAARPRGPARRAIELVAATFVSTPVYVIGLTLLLLFGAGIGDWIDLGVPTEYGGVGTLIVPWLVLGLPLAGLCVRAMASSAEAVLAEDHIHFARARGITERRILLRHVLPPSVTPALALASASANIMLLNMVLVERVFSVPGFLVEVGDSVRDGDVPVLLALSVVAAVFVVATSILLGALVDAIDPRARRSGA